MNIYVGNLSSQATVEELREAFEAFGQVSAANIMKDKYSGESRGFGFVEMPTKAEAEAAITELNGKLLGGNNIVVSEARPRTDKRPGGGGRGEGGWRGGGGGRGGDRGEGGGGGRGGNQGQRGGGGRSSNRGQRGGGGQRSW